MKTAQNDEKWVSRKLMVKYVTTSKKSGKKLERYQLSSQGNAGWFEFTGLGGNKSCQEDEIIGNVVKGEVECKPSKIAGIQGNQGIRGDQGDEGDTGQRYQHRYGGCFDPYTKVKMSTGEFKQIKDILLSDKIYNPMTGNSVAIKSIVRGPELLPMLKLQTATFDIEVTHGHAMVVKDQKNNAISIVMAKDVKSGDLVQTKNGFEKLLGVEKVFKGPDYLVYNLDLEGEGVTTSHLVQAEGFVTGDLYLQLKLDKVGQMSNVGFNTIQD